MPSKKINEQVNLPCEKHSFHKKKISYGNKKNLSSPFFEGSVFNRDDVYTLVTPELQPHEAAGFSN